MCFVYRGTEVNSQIHMDGPSNTAMHVTQVFVKKGYTSTYMH